MPDIVDIEELLAEVDRYLSAVDTFREEQREPTWLAEEEEARCVQS